MSTDMMHDQTVKDEPSKAIQERIYTRREGHEAETGAEPDEASINRVYRKLDLRIIPAFWVLYFLCSAIRSNVGLAQTMNANVHHDLGSVLHLTPHQVSTGLALFYVCYVVFDLPSNLAMLRLSPHVWMSRIVVSVGVIGACMAAMRAAWSFYLLRLLLGIVIAGMWPGMTYYLSLFYPPSQMGKRTGQYYTAAQVSAAVVGLVSAGFQKMDGERGLVGFRWMFLVYGVVTVIVGVGLLWWLPDRPVPPASFQQQHGQDGEEEEEEGKRPRRKYIYFLRKFWPKSPPALAGRDAEIHYHDLRRVYHRSRWTFSDLLAVFADWRLWPLVIMYFGVVGVGIGVQSYSTVIIKATDSSLTGVELSLLSAPIWIVSSLSSYLCKTY